MRRIVSIFVLTLAMPVLGIAQQQSTAPSTDAAAKPAATHAKTHKKPATKPAAKADAAVAPGHGTPQGDTQK
jgi:hypothetical protein